MHGAARALGVPSAGAARWRARARAIARPGSGSIAQLGERGVGGDAIGRVPRERALQHADEARARLPVEARRPPLARCAASAAAASACPTARRSRRRRPRRRRRRRRTRRPARTRGRSGRAASAPPRARDRAPAAGGAHACAFRWATSAAPGAGRARSSGAARRSLPRRLARFRPRRPRRDALASHVACERRARAAASALARRRTRGRPPRPRAPSRAGRLVHAIRRARRGAASTTTPRGRACCAG